jgi:NAD(P)-dependent dehydrogenase (short-subunit alcohol dehydrogenase family)
MIGSPQDAQTAVEAAVARFGRIDILVNNAGNFFAGFFEELSPASCPPPSHTTMPDHEWLAWRQHRRLRIAPDKGLAFAGPRL